MNPDDMFRNEPSAISITELYGADVLPVIEWTVSKAIQETQSTDREYYLHLLFIYHQIPKGRGHCPLYARSSMPQCQYQEQQQ